MKPSVKTSLLLIATLTFSGMQVVQAKPKPKPNDLAIYSIVHAIPSGFGADVVDVYANDKLVIDNATPGNIKSLSVPRGSISVSIYANGVIPSPTTTPLLKTTPVYLSYGSNISFVAHLTADEKPKLSLFKNSVTEAGSKRSWLTIRNVGAVSPLQIRANGLPVFVPLSNGMERKRSFLFGSYSVDALFSETNTVAINPISLDLKRGTNVVLYIWGAKSKNNLAFLKEEISTRK